MEHVFVAVASAPAILTQNLFDAIRHAFNTESAKPRWLATGVAADITLAVTPDSACQASIAALLKDAPVDWAFIPAADRRKRLLVADMDSTIISCECIDELADFAGIKEKVAAITERAMRGEIDFKGALQERVAMLANLPVTVLARTYEERVRLNPGARTLIQTMRSHGAYTALVSGGFTYFTSRVREACGFNIDQANILLEKDGALTGLVQQPIVDASTKLAALQRLSAERAIPIAQTLAIGDGANDLPMIQAAGLGVAYRAKPKVAAEARAKITHGDLTGVLYLQGFMRDEFVSND